MSPDAWNRAIVRFAGTAFLTAACGMTTGCATMVHGTTQQVSIASSPSGARVDVNGQQWETPCSVPLSRKCSHHVIISKPGYQTAARIITPVPTGAVFGNILFGGLVGLGVDAATGANNELQPKYIDVALEPEMGQSQQTMAYRRGRRVRAPDRPPPGEDSDDENGQGIHVPDE